MVMKTNVELLACSGRERRPRSRTAPGRRRRRDHPGPLPGDRSADRPQAGPHPGDRRRPRGRGRDPGTGRCRASRRSGRRGGAGRRAHRKRTDVGARPDRRHQELLPRFRRVGVADRVDRGRRAAGRGGERARAGSALVGGPRSGRLDQRRPGWAGATDHGVRSRIPGRRVPVHHRHPRLRTPGPRRALPAAGGRPAGRPARSATSGSTAWWPRVCSTWPSTRSRTRGTWPRCCRSSPRRVARSPISPG